MAGEFASNSEYLEIILRKVRVCKTYKPRFGQGSAGLTLDQFQELYRRDAFYSWFGLDTPLVYSAHRAAGGITSVYRQIGIGCEELFRRIIQDALRTLSLDARINLADIQRDEAKERIIEWIKLASHSLNIVPEIVDIFKGAVFEVRQGYKSKDAKRQNADIANAATAYTQGYLPVLAVLSTQIDNDVAYRYRNAKWLVLRGYAGESAITSTYKFTHDVSGYDLAGFFERNADAIKITVMDVLETLLGSDE